MASTSLWQQSCLRPCRTSTDRTQTRHAACHSPACVLRSTRRTLASRRNRLVSPQASLERSAKLDSQQTKVRKTLKPKTSLDPSDSEGSSSSCHATEQRSLAAFSAALEEEPLLAAASPTEQEQSSGQTGGSVLGAIALITGTSVGAGILALPQETSTAGFIPSASLLVISWAFLTLEAFLIADVNIGLLKKRRNQDKASAESSGSDVISLRTMAEETLGPVGGLLSTATYVFLSYTLVVAYIAKAADVATLGMDVSYDVAAAAFVASLGGLVYAGNTQTTDWLNRIMTGGLLTLFFLIIFGGSVNADWSQLSHQDWSQAPGTLPVVFLSLVFHDLIPVLCTYLDGDLKRVRTAIAVGGAVPLAMFLLWDAVALSLSGGVTGVDPLEVLMSLGGSTQGAIVEGFSILAVMTSFIGTALSFSEFFIEQLNALVPRFGKKEERPARIMGPEVQEWRQNSSGANLTRQQVLRASAFTMVLVPSWAIACSTPDAFFAASEAAGAYGMTVLYGIFPPLMFWKARQHAKESRETEGKETSHQGEWWDKPAGGFALASMAVCAFSVIVSQAALDTASLRSGDQMQQTSSTSPVVVLASTTPVSHSLQSPAKHRPQLEDQVLQAPVLEADPTESEARSA